MTGTEFFAKSGRPNEVTLDGRIVLDGSSDVASFTIKGVASIAHTATGKYTLTMSDRWQGGLKSITAVIQDASAFVAVFPQLWGDAGGDLIDTPPVIKLGFSDGTAFADPPASEIIFVSITVQRGNTLTDPA